MDKSETYIKMCREVFPYLKGCVPLFSKRRRMYYVVDGKVGMWWDIVNTSNCERAFPLWEQDQLQEMVNELPESPKHIIGRLYDFADFVHKKPYLPKRYNDIEKDEACHFFTSMEQLWLAFVMKERFGEEWRDGEWK